MTTISSFLQQISRDLRYGVRTLGRAPGFSITVIFVLALGIGASTAVFSVIEGVLLRPWPYSHPDRLCLLWKSIPQRNIEWDWTSAPTINDWRTQTDVFADLATILRPEGSRVTLRGESGTQKLQASLVSGNFFDLLGTAPLRGRTFSRAEAQRGENVAVLSYGFWQRQFGASESILGKTIHLDDRSVQIIGVMPPSFQFPDKRAELWLLLTADPRWPTFQMPRFRIADAFCALGRLKPGRSIAEARTQMKAASARLALQHPATDAGLEARVVPFGQQIAGPQVRRALWILGAAVFSVLLIACSNVASLLVARGAARKRELAVRAALGAGQRRLLAQLAAESMLLSLAGGIGGIALAYGGLHSLMALAPPDLPRADGIAINNLVLGFSFGLCVLTGLIFGLLPASQIARIEARGGFDGGGRGASSGKGVQRLRGTLVAAQFAMAIVLLSGAGLLVRSFLLLNAVERGFDTTHLLTVQVSLSGDKYQAPARSRAFFDQALQRLQALPGVQGAATGSTVFESFQGNAPNQGIVVQGKPLAQDPTRHGRDIVSNGYFRLLGIPLRAGRLFSAEDVAGNPPVAVINEKMARHFWPYESAIGKRFKALLPGMEERDWITVIGVVGDVLYNRDGVILPVYYLPADQRYQTESEIVLRCADDPRTVANAVSREVQSIDPTLPRFRVETVEDRLAEQDRPRRFQTELIGIFAAIALVLAATGLYGLMSYSVEQRTREIGIRLALGATSADIARLVLQQGLAWAAGGMAIGTIGAAFFGRALASWLYRTTATDPVTLTAVCAMLALVTLLATAVPALRASKVDPTVSLRHE